LLFLHERLDHLVGELLARGVDDLFVGEVLAYFMADGVQQVRLAEPDIAPDEERVPLLARVVGDGRRGGVGQVVPLGPAEMAEKSSVSTPLPTSNTATRRFSRQTEGSIGPT